MKEKSLCYKREVLLDYSFACIVLCSLFILEKTVFVNSSRLFMNFIDILQWPFLIFILYIFLRRKYTNKSLILSITVLIIFFLSYRNSGLASLFKYSVVVLSARGINSMRIYKKFRITYMFLLSSIFLLGLLRIIPSVTVRRDYFTYGFIHSNVLAMFTFSAICSDAIYNYKRITSKRILIYSLIVLVIIILTDCRSVLLGCVSLIAFLLLYNRKKINLNRHKIIKNLISCIPILLTIISFLVAYNYDPDNPLMVVINNLSSQRIYMADILTRYYSPVLMGQDCKNALMENAYLTVFFAWGIIPGSITVGFYCYSIYKAISKNNYGLAASLLGFAIQGLFEGSTFELFMNIALIATFISYDTIVLDSSK